jgi:flavin reductase (DIM6/NTAB) family NADH-FMN oxidoreductase RutF
MKRFFKVLLVTLPVIVPCALMNQEAGAGMESEFTGFRKTTWEALDENAIRIIGKEWMLVGAGNKEKGFNMMTASWGGLGWLWEKPVSFIFVRPQRYTHEFTEREDYYTITFFEEQYKDVLRQMGTVSGRNFDKINNSGLTPFTTLNGSIGFREARIIVECRKLYADAIEEGAFADQALAERTYPNKDFHTMYVGEIVNVWVKE